MATYFGFAIADGMFGDGMTVTRKVVDVFAVRAMIEAGVIPALNPTHEATINAMRTRYGLNVEIPEKAPMIKLMGGDKFIVMSVRGLPRREGGKGEYTQEEIDGATFEFSVWEVQQEPQSPSYGGFATCSVCGNTDVVSWGKCVHCGTPFDFNETEEKKPEVLSFQVDFQAVHDDEPYIELAKRLNTRLVIVNGFWPNTVHYVFGKPFDGAVINVDGHKPADVQAAIS